MVGDGKCRWPLRRGWSTLELLLQRGKVDLGRALGDLAVADAPEGHAAEFEAPAGRLNCRAIGPCAATPDHTRCNGVASSDDVSGTAFSSPKVACTALHSNSDGSPGQQESGAERDQCKTGPVRFDSKARSRPFGFQSIARLSGAKSPSAT
jgi:hypothetical protein